MRNKPRSKRRVMLLTLGVLAAAGFRWWILEMHVDNQQKELSEQTQELKK